MDHNNYKHLSTAYQATAHTSTAYSLYHSNWSEQQNQQVYGSYYSTEGTGCNFQLDAKTYGALTTEEARQWKALVKKSSLIIDHKHLNQDVPYFKDRTPTLENIASYLYENIEWPHPFEIRVYEGPDEWVEFGPYGHRYTQKVNLACVHKHWNPELSAEENKDLYGKCSGLHGHEYTVHATVTGEVDAETGWIISRDKMQNILQDEIVKPFHGQFLNEFLGNTSGEKIAMQFHEILKKQFLTHSLCRTVVKETRKNSFYIGEPPF